jgi:MFS family permease
MTNLVSNRKVYARIRSVKGVLKSDVEREFSEEGWVFERQQDKIGVEVYLVAISLYCARSVAISVTRKKLQEFSSHRSPILVDEIRLAKSTEDRRRNVVVSRHSGSWINLLPRGLRESPELSLDPLHWEVSVFRSQLDSSADRRDQELSQAKKVLAESLLPGERFTRAKMKTGTRSGPKRVPRSPWSQPWRYILFVAAWIAATVASVVGSTLIWLDIHPLARIFGLVLALGGSCTGGLWLTGDRISKGIRAVTVSLLVLIIGLYGWILSKNIPQNENIVYYILAAICLIIIFVGWAHLIIIYPKIKIFGSIPVLTLMGASASIFSQFLLSALGSGVGVPAEEVAIPGWFKVLSAALVFVCIGAMLFILGGVLGWLAYFGLGIGSGIDKIFTSLILVLISLVWVTFGSMFAMSASTIVMSSLESNLESNRTPEISSEFLFRGCIKSPSSDNLGSLAGWDLNRPVVIVKNKDGSSWALNDFWASHDRTEIMSADIGDSDVYPLKDGETSCRV